MRLDDVGRRAAMRRVLAVALTLAVALVGWSLARHGASPGPLSSAHRKANLACSACHSADVETAAAACTHCHDASDHAQTFRGHRLLAQRDAAALACPTCHVVHDREATRLEPLVDGAPIALVTGRACARCHDLGAARDPVRRCVTRLDAPVGCDDLHGHVTLTQSRTFALARQASTAVQASSLTVHAYAHADAGLAALAIALGLVAYRIGPRRRVAPPSPEAPIAREAAPGVVRRLPVIDAARCLGCRACVDACAFDVLDVSRFVATVVRPDACCSALTCAEVCPNGSLTMVDGGRVPDRAQLDAHLESPDAPGIFLAGDVSGVPLIKNAIRQGRAVADRVAERPRARTGPDAPHDLLIIGAGPAGLSATLRATELGLAVVTLEQGELAASIRAFPRGKLVFERPLTLPLEGDLWMEECTKERLITEWERIVRTRRLPLRTRHRVVRITRAEEDVFVVDAEAASDDGAPTVHSFRARHVLFAVGTRGSPRPLGAPIDPAAAERVAYSLADAASFAGRQVVVVGLGDSAMEAALALARQPDANVTVLHRGRDFTRGSARNVAELRAAVAAGRIALHFDARVIEVGATNVQVEVAGQPRALPFEQLFVLTGGTAPWPLLASAGVRVRDDAQEPDAAGQTLASSVTR